MFRLARAGTFRGLAALSIAVTVAACSSSAAPSTEPSQSVLAATPVVTSAPVTEAPATPTAVATPMSSAADTSAPSALAATAVPTSLDPCKLVTAQEASQLAGATYTTGKEETTQGNGRFCWYGAQTTNVFEVVVAQAPDAATLQAEKTAALAKIQQGATGPAKTTMLTGIGDEAAFLSLSQTISGQTLNGSGIYVVKGLVFFAIVDIVLGKPAPSSAAMQAQAQTVITRLP